MAVVEYTITGTAERHARYFATFAAARSFSEMLKRDAKCSNVRIRF